METQQITVGSIILLMILLLFFQPTRPLMLKIIGFPFVVLGCLGCGGCLTVIIAAIFGPFIITIVAPIFAFIISLFSRLIGLELKNENVLLYLEDLLSTFAN